MKHQQFKTWILADTDLNQEQHRELQVHLKQCSQCQSLFKATQQIAHLFKTSPVPEPSPGFSTRWMTHLEKNRESEKSDYSRHYAQFDLICHINSALKRWIPNQIDPGLFSSNDVGIDLSHRKLVCFPEPNLEYHHSPVQG